MKRLDYDQMIQGKFTDKAPCGMWHRMTAWKKVGESEDSCCMGDSRLEQFFCRKCNIFIEGSTADCGPSSPDFAPLLYWRVLKGIAA